MIVDRYGNKHFIDLPEDTMNESDTILLRGLHKQCLVETESARVKFPADKAVETLPLVYGQNALIEEIGKLSRCFNKLVIATDADVVQQWREEANRRIVTSISLLHRMYLIHRRGGTI